MTKKVEEIMVRSLQTAPPDTTLNAAAEQMSSKRIRHLPVVDPGSGKLLGIVSDRDLKRFSSPFAGSKSATDRDNATLNVRLDKIMMKEVITSKPADTAKSLVEKMLQKRINAVIIVDDHTKPIGIVTTSDLLKILLTVF